MEYIDEILEDTYSTINETLSDALRFVVGML